MAVTSVFVPKADLLLHPVRLRIVKTFLGDRALTTSQLAGELADVPMGSLYRHVAKLAGAGVLQVVGERNVRGIIERTYTLRLHAARIGVAEADAMTPEEHSRAFTAYVAGLLADAERYIHGPSPDFARDGFGYHTAAMWLTDAEYTELVRDLLRTVQPRMANGPAKGRKRRLLYTVFLPGPELQRESNPKVRARQAR